MELDGSRHAAAATPVSGFSIRHDTGTVCPNLAQDSRYRLLQHEVICQVPTVSHRPVLVTLPEGHLSIFWMMQCGPPVVKGQPSIRRGGVTQKVGPACNSDYGWRVTSPGWTYRGERHCLTRGPPFPKTHPSGGRGQRGRGGQPRHGEIRPSSLAASFLRQPRNGCDK